MPIWATFWHFDEKSDNVNHFFFQNAKKWPKRAIFKGKIDWKSKAGAFENDVKSLKI
tara:strand:- start:246 stop:416 length:171 start_codon:yes stop_codon:yes gene_type:complete